MRDATLTDSEPLFMQMKCENGQPPRVCPISRLSSSARRFWLNAGVMTLAMTQERDIAFSTVSGACPRPSMP
jgi:hypothetical protein